MTQITTEMLARVARHALGLDALNDNNDGVIWIEGGKVRFDPRTNAEQDRMLRDWLLKRFTILMDTPEHHQLWDRTGKLEHVEFDCPPNDFLVLAVDAVLKMEGDNAG